MPQFTSTTIPPPQYMEAPMRTDLMGQESPEEQDPSSLRNQYGQEEPPPQPDPYAPPPQAPPKPPPIEKKKDTFKGLLGNFLFSLGRGLEASSQSRPGYETAAGLGGALQGTEEFKQNRKKLELQETGLQDDLARRRLYEEQAQRTSQYQGEFIQREQRIREEAEKSRVAAKALVGQKLEGAGLAQDKAQTFKHDEATNKEKFLGKMLDKQIDSREKIAGMPKTLIHAWLKAKQTEKGDEPLTSAEVEEGYKKMKETAEKPYFLFGNLTNAFTGEPMGIGIKDARKGTVTGVDGQPIDTQGVIFGNLPQPSAMIQERITGVNLAIKQLENADKHLKVVGGPAFGRVTLFQVDSLGGQWATEEQITAAKYLRRMVVTEAFSNGGKQLTNTEKEEFFLLNPQMTDTVQQAFINAKLSLAYLKEKRIEILRAMPPAQRRGLPQDIQELLSVKPKTNAKASSDDEYEAPIQRVLKGGKKVMAQKNKKTSEWKILGPTN